MTEKKKFGRLKKFGLWPKKKLVSQKQTSSWFGDEPRLHRTTVGLQRLSCSATIRNSAARVWLRNSGMSYGVWVTAETRDAIVAARIATVRTRLLAAIFPVLPLFRTRLTLRRANKQELPGILETSWSSHWRTSLCFVFLLSNSRRTRSPSPGLAPRPSPAWTSTASTNWDRTKLRY